MLNEGSVNLVLRKVWENLQKNKESIFLKNKIDVENAKQLGKPPSFIERLVVSERTIAGMLVSIDEVIKQPCPVGVVLKEWVVPHNGLEIQRVACSIGRILIIYESRPNVTLEAFSLCFKSGNSCILRGGSESFETSREIVRIIHQSFDDSGFSEYKNVVEYVQTKERSAIVELLKKSNEIDLIIPRGGKSLVEFVVQNTTIPILKHLDGNCHTYIENTAEFQTAFEILKNAKMRRVSVCGATESLVIDEKFAREHLAKIVSLMPECEFVGCEVSRQIYEKINPATDEDFYTEYLGAKLSVKVVKSYHEAIEFINKHSSKHTECIISNNVEAVECFLQNIDSANVMHNVSTQFADGYEFGFGAEIGIATGKIHARGPVGLGQLVIYKNIVKTKGYAVRK